MLLTVPPAYPRIILSVPLEMPILTGPTPGSPGRSCAIVSILVGDTLKSGSLTRMYTITSPCVKNSDFSSIIPDMLVLWMGNIDRPKGMDSCNTKSSGMPHGIGYTVLSKLTEPVVSGLAKTSGKIVKNSTAKIIVNSKKNCINFNFLSVFPT